MVIRGQVERESGNRWGLFGSADQDAVARLVLRLGGSTGTPEPAGLRLSFTYCDTFDWRMHRQGWTLVRREGSFLLKDRRTGALLASQAAPRATVPRFARDFDPGPLRDRLEGVIGVRALLQLVTVNGSVRTHEVVHPSSGCLWRLEHQSLTLVRQGREKPFLETVSLLPNPACLRGGRWLVKQIRAAGLVPLPPTLLEPALARGGLRPGSNSGKIRPALEPDLAAGEAAVLIAQHLLKTMKANLEGMTRDIDTEFLHDFRVAVRRTRSLVSSLKGTLPPEIRREAGARFALVSDMTGPLRDLDVFLLRFPAYLEILPEEHHRGLREIFDLVARRRAAARREFEARLQEKELQIILADWERYLLEDATDLKDRPPKAQRPIGPVAGKVIAGRFRKVRRRVTAGEGEMKDADLHRLRIEGKKLRYALEFFASLYSGREVAKVLGALKKMQDLLGDHNDLVVQLENLRSLQREENRDRLSAAAAAAAMALEACLEERRARLRKGITKICTRFAGPGIAGAMRKIVGSG